MCTLIALPFGRFYQCLGVGFSMFLVLFFPSVDGAARQQPKPELVNARLMVLKTELNSVFVSGIQSRRFTNDAVFLSKICALEFTLISYGQRPPVVVHARL